MCVTDNANWKDNLPIFLSAEGITHFLVRPTSTAAWNQASTLHRRVRLTSTPATADFCGAVTPSLTSEMGAPGCRYGELYWYPMPKRPVRLSRVVFNNCFYSVAPRCTRFEPFEQPCAYLPSSTGKKGQDIRLYVLTVPGWAVRRGPRLAVYPWLLTPCVEELVLVFFTRRNNEGFL